MPCSGYLCLVSWLSCLMVLLSSCLLARVGAFCMHNWRILTLALATCQLERVFVRPYLCLAALVFYGLRSTPSGCCVLVACAWMRLFVSGAVLRVDALAFGFFPFWFGSWLEPSILCGAFTCHSFSERGLASLVAMKCLCLVVCRGSRSLQSLVAHPHRWRNRSMRLILHGRKLHLRLHLYVCLWQPIWCLSCLGATCIPYRGDVFLNLVQGLCCCVPCLCSMTLSLTWSDPLRCDASVRMSSVLRRALLLFLSWCACTFKVDRMHLHYCVCGSSLGSACYLLKQYGSIEMDVGDNAISVPKTEDEADGEAGVVGAEDENLAHQPLEEAAEELPSTTADQDLPDFSPEEVPLETGEFQENSPGHDAGGSAEHAPDVPTKPEINLDDENACSAESVTLDAPAVET
eukprot:831850-Amphidinium_carterae.1